MDSNPPRAPSSDAAPVHGGTHTMAMGTHPPLLSRAETTDASCFPTAKALPMQSTEMIRERSNSWTTATSLLPARPASQSMGMAPLSSSSSLFPASEHVMDEKAKAKLQKEMNNAVKVVETFFNPKLLKDQSIPLELLMEANGLVFLTVYKVGFLFSGKMGNGFVIARTTSGWSAPSFLSSGGIGFGMMAGGEMVNYMIILNSRSAVKVFTRNGQFQLGSELDLAVGPIGRAASAALNVGRGGIAPNYSYSHSVGLYGGIGLTSAVICTRKSLNAKCYGPHVTARQILGGDVPCPLAVPLWQALDKALGVQRAYVNGLPVCQPAVTRGFVVCDACGYQNPTETHRHTCDRCQHLLVHSVSVHSGRRNFSQLVVSSELSASEERK